jgi:aminoglycoside phosphotransferase family enzyme
MVLGGDRALKIKRAVRIALLDYSTLEKRRCACEEELKVSAGNAPGSTGALSLSPQF